jgi:hypothetical protein
MRRRTLHQKAVEATQKFFVLTLDRMQLAIPMTVVLRVLSPQQSSIQPIAWEGLPITTLDLRDLSCDVRPMESSDPAIYTLIICTDQAKPWGLQTPTIPNILKLPTQAIKELPITENDRGDRSLSHLSDRFITIGQGEEAQTIFLINLPHLAASIGKL